MKGRMRKGFIGLLTAAAGLIMILSGTQTGGAESVMAKAIRICLECIGIG